MTNSSGEMTTPNQAVYRVRSHFRRVGLAKRFVRTWEIVDDFSQQVMAMCDQEGRVSLTVLTITDSHGGVWQMRPNRKILPTRWAVLDPEQKVSVWFDQKILGKVINPVYRTVLAMQDHAGKEIYRVIDPRSSIPDRILGLGPDDWALMDDDTPVARLTYLPRPSKPGRGFWDKIKKLLAVSDRGIISARKDHVLSAPVALGMCLLVDELTDRSAD